VERDFEGDGGMDASAEEIRESARQRSLSSELPKQEPARGCFLASASERIIGTDNMAMLAVCVEPL